MEQFRILSNTGRIKRLESEVTALEAGMNPPIEADLDMNSNAITEVTSLKLNDGSTGEISTGVVQYNAGKLLVNGHEIDAQNVVHNPLTTALNVNDQQLNNVGTIHMQDNSSNIWFKDGDNNPRSLTCDDEDDLVWDGKKVITEGANDHLTQDVTLQGRTVRGLFGIAFDSNPDALLKDESGNRLIWNGEDLQTSNWTVDQNASNHKIYDVSEIQFDNAPNVDLTADNTGKLLWNGNVIGHESASGVHNPMQSTLDANGYNISDLEKVEFGYHDGALPWAPNSISGQQVGSNKFLFMQGENLSLQAGSSSDPISSVLIDNEATKIRGGLSTVGRFGIQSYDSSDYGYLGVTGSGSTTKLAFNGVDISQTNGSSHDLQNVKSVGFDSAISLSTNQETNGVQLLFGDHQLTTYQPASNGNISLAKVSYPQVPSAVPSTSLSGALYPVNQPFSYVTPEGIYSYDVKVNLTVDQSDLPSGVSFNWNGLDDLYLYCSATDLTSANGAVTVANPNSSNIDLPSDAVMLVKAPFSEVSISTNKQTSICSFMIESVAGTSDDGHVVSYGWDPVRCAGKNYLYCVITGSYTDAQGDEVGYSVNSFSMSITRAFKQHSLTLTNGTQSSSLAVADTGDLMLGTDLVSTHKSTSLQTTDDSSTVIASHRVKAGTCGLIQAYCYSETSAFKMDAHVVESGGTATVSGSLIHEISNPDNHTFSVSTSGDMVVLLVSGKAGTTLNWKSKWVFDSVIQYVDPGYGESLFFPFTEDLDDDIVPVSPNTLISGDWYQFTDNSMEIQAMASGAHYQTDQADMDLNTNFSMSFWVNIPSSTNPYNGMFLSTTQPSDNNASGWRVMTYSSNIDWSIHLNSGKILYKRIPYNVLKGAGWVHMVYTYDGESADSVGDSLKAYWDGVDKGAGAVAGGSLSKSNPIGFPGGNFSITGKNSSQSFGGWKISHLRFWKRVITAEEIAKLASDRA